METKLTADQIKSIEDSHNVYVDGDHFTVGQRDDIYGWEPLPEEWIAEATAGGKEMKHLTDLILEVANAIDPEGGYYKVYDFPTHYMLNGNYGEEEWEGTKMLFVKDDETTQPKTQKGDTAIIKEVANEVSPDGGYFVAYNGLDHYMLVKDNGELTRINKSEEEK